MKVRTRKVFYLIPTKGGVDIIQLVPGVDWHGAKHTREVSLGGGGQWPGMRACTNTQGVVFVSNMEGVLDNTVLHIKGKGSMGVMVYDMLLVQMHEGMYLAAIHGLWTHDVFIVGE